ncbi:MAG: hypothetical protein WAT81_05420 [Candidatus Moraniibacteriota bacterium]
MAHAEAVKYYSEAYIQSELKSVSENTYANPAGTVYTERATYCAVRANADSSICSEPVRNLSASDFAAYGEGCLSKDGTAFIAVFPGEYMGEATWYSDTTLKAMFLKWQKRSTKQHSMIKSGLLHRRASANEREKR